MPSTVIAEMNYDPGKMELTVLFVSGLKYVYMNVPEAEFIAMKTSGAKGIYLNRHIKGRYEFRKVEMNR